MAHSAVFLARAGFIAPLEPVRRWRPYPSVATILPQRLIYAYAMEFTEVIKRRTMVRAFSGEPLAPGTADRLLKAAERAPSAGFSQWYSFLVLEGAEQCAPLWKILADAVDAE